MINYTNNIELINSFLSHFNTSINKISIFSKYIIYKEKENIIGFLDFSYIYDRIEINYIYVNEDFRNNNIASKLINELLYFADKKKCKNITLEVNENNYAAIKLYRKYNFITASIRKKYYGNDNGLLMIREMI